MRSIILIICILSVPYYLIGQKRDLQTNIEVLHHNISINPLNIVLFQQVGITYEYRPGKLGFGITPGYIYPNKQEYSNWFIAGPANYGSLGWYSGWFVVPQLNLYLTKQKDSDEGGVFYLAAKFVYKHMQLDTTSVTVWKNEGDGYYSYRKMIDKVNVYGGFVDVGFRYFLSHFFLDLNLGMGPMWLNHNMIVYAEAYGTNPSPMHYLNPPREEKFHQWAFSINFILNLGVGF